MKATLITSNMDLTSKQADDLLAVYTRTITGEDGFNVIAATHDVAGEFVPTTTVNLFKQEAKEHTFYLQLTNLKEGVSPTVLAKAVIDGYIELCSRKGDIGYDADLSKFILTNARRVGMYGRFYRDDGIVMYRVLCTMITLMENENLILDTVTPTAVNHAVVGNVITIRGIKK